MKNKRIIVKNNDGSIKIISPAPDLFNVNSKTSQLLINRGIDLSTEQKVFEHVIARNIEVGQMTKDNHIVVDVDDIPKDRTLRKHWVLNNNKIEIKVES